MDVMKTVREIGFFETACNISIVADSETVRSRVEESMPMPDDDFASSIERVTEWLMQYGKRKLMLLSPEIAIIEALAQKGMGEYEIILVIPSDMDPESKQRLKNNIPKEIQVQLLEEPFFPDNFLPRNGLIVAFGCIGGNRLMVLPETYSMIEHYSKFLGRKVFVPYVNCEYPVRLGEWIEVGYGKFEGVWEDYKWKI